MSQINRRDFIKVMGVSSTTALVACDPTVPLENVLPYVIQPDQIVPGLSTWFATKCNECSAGCGVVARNREGRVVKLEGNDAHPTNQGKLCARGQAGILGTYSPDRFTGPMAAGKSTDWETAHKTLSDGIVSARTAGKDVVWIGSPKTAATNALIQQFIAASGGKVLYWDPIEPPGLRAASAAVFGRNGMPRFVLDQAHTILSFGADFLGTWGSQVEHSLGYANSRDPEKGDFVSRLVCVEPRVGTTSAMADLHLAPVPGTEAGLAMAMAKLLADSVGYKGAALSLVNDVNVRDLIEVSGISEERVKEVVQWLAESPSAVLPGGVGTSAAVSELATAVLILNEVAGNIGKSVVFGPETKTESRASYNDVVKLLAECAAGKVGVLLMDGLDLAHLLPTDLNTKTSLSKVDLFVAFENEPTDSLTENALVLPTGSTLETWGDGEEVAGRYTLQQPAMNPLHDTKSAGETLLAVAKLAGLKTVVAPADAENAEADAEAPETESEDGTEAPPVVAAPVPGLDAASHVAYIKGWWEATVWPAMGQTGTMANFWTQCQQQGGAFVDIAVEIPSIVLGALPATAGEAPSGDGLILTLFPHPFIMDGRHANKPWAQEVPEPLSSYTWGTWIEIHPETADQLGLTAEHGVTVSTPQGQIEAGWFGSPGIRKDTIAVVMGNGHTNSGRYTRFGANPITLLASKADGENFAYVATRATVRRSASTINNHAYLGSLTMEGRGINFTVSKDDLGTGHGAGSIVPAHHVPVDKRLTDNGLNDMYPEPPHPPDRFGMTVEGLYGLWFLRNSLLR